MAGVVTQQCCVAPVLAEQGWSDMSPSWLAVGLCVIMETPCIIIGHDVHECGSFIHQWNEILTNFPSCLVQHFCEWMGNHMWCIFLCHQILSKDGMAACIWYLPCCGSIIDNLMKNSVYSALHFTDHLWCMYFSQKITPFVILKQRTLLEQTLPLQLSASTKPVVTTWCSISSIANTTWYYLITPVSTLLIFCGMSCDEHSITVFLNFHNYSYLNQMVVGYGHQHHWHSFSCTKLLQNGSTNPLTFWIS
jgi:hypothetical protein